MEGLGRIHRARRIRPKELSGGDESVQLIRVEGKR